MERLAEAFIRATQYISSRDDACTTDDDVKQLEDLAYLVSHCSSEEKQVLIAVASKIGLSVWPQEMGLVE